MTFPRYKFKMIPERVVMVILCALCVLINYADRVNMSVAIIPLSEHFNYPLTEQSYILSSFFLGYLPMNIGGACLCRRFGAKKVLAIGASLWSLFTILTPVVARFGLVPLLICRVLMGLSEGVAFPSVYHFLGVWIPPAERGRSVALFLTGVHIGTCVALIVSPWIIKKSSWQMIFYIFGSVGYIWVALWSLIAYDKDELKKPSDGSTYARLSQVEDPPNKTTDDKSAQQLTPSCYSFLPVDDFSLIKKILTYRQYIALCFVQALFNMIHYIILSWLPTYFKNVYDLETTSLSFTFLPYACMAISANLGGFMADRMLQSGMSVTSSRRLITIIANTGAAIAILLSASAQSVSLSLALISISMACMSLNSGGFESAYLDMAPPSDVGIFKATANTLGSFSGFIAVPLSTLILTWLNGSWRGMFASMSIGYFIMTVVFCVWVRCEKLWGEEERIANK